MMCTVKTRIKDALSGNTSTFDQPNQQNLHLFIVLSTVLTVHTVVNALHFHSDAYLDFSI